MNIFNQHPSPELHRFVNRLWGWESGPTETVDLPTLLPGTGAELYFHYGEPFRLKAQGDLPANTHSGHLFCIRRTPIPMAPTTGIGFIAVRFRIGMLQRFTAIPADELADSQYSVEDLWGVSGTRLLGHLSYATKHQERVALIQSFLIKHLRPESADALVEQGMVMLYRRCASMSIDMLADTLCLGRRQLERRWRAFSGQSPSESKSLCRFQQTVRGLMLDPTGDTADRALVGGYYDQAHFVHDFRRRVGLAPQRYLRVARSKTHFYNTSLR